VILHTTHVSPLLIPTHSPAGTAYCQMCVAGTYSAAGASYCSPCPAGTSSLPGSSACASCPKGTYTGMHSWLSSACFRSQDSCPASSACMGWESTFIVPEVLLIKSSCYLSVCKEASCFCCCCPPPTLRSRDCQPDTMPAIHTRRCGGAPHLLPMPCRLVRLNHRADQLYRLRTWRLPVLANRQLPHMEHSVRLQHLYRQRWNQPQGRDQVLGLFCKRTCGQRQNMSRGCSKQDQIQQQRVSTYMRAQELASLIHTAGPLGLHAVRMGRGAQHLPVQVRRD
jgi:hypothetical protein